jgi:hypothetical protein
MIQNSPKAEVRGSNPFGRATSKTFSVCPLYPKADVRRDHLNDRLGSISDILAFTR